MKYLFIVNPTAGGKDQTETIRQLAESSFSGREDSFEIYVTKSPRDATDEVRRRAKSGEELRIFACGGDGTFNECVNGAAGAENLAVAPFPSGTGNDFIRMFDDEKKLFTNLSAFFNGTVHKIDLIRANGYYSDCICSVGIDARIGAGVHRYTSLPFCKGKLAYIVSLVVELCKGLSQPMKISCGDYQMNGPVTLCCVCNGQHYGGGFHPAPDARPDDGILDIFIVGKLTLFQVIAAIGKYAKGQADDIPELITHLRSDCISIEADSPFLLNMDGEVQTTTKAKLQLVPQCLNLLIPDGLSFFNKHNK